MQLNKFIEETLIQINNGIKKTNKNSDLEYYLDNVTSKGVHFDLAVTSSTSSKDDIKGGAGVGIEVLGAKIGASESTENLDKTENRIKFNITYKNPRNELR